MNTDNPLLDFAQSALKSIEAKGLFRRRRTLSTAQGVLVDSDGSERLNFCSNDYLGLANHPQVITAFKNAADRYGVGSGASHLVCGHSNAHHALEEELAEFTGRDRALLFSTGYMANLGTISALAGNSDTILEDRLNHASLIDGGLLAQARFHRYRHCDTEHLNGLLAKANGNKLIVTDGVFSMDGDLAPLPDLAHLARTHSATLMVDDAHGLGIIGTHGGGTLEHYRLDQSAVPLLVGTLGKAFGTFGAFVAGPNDLIELLLQKARSYIYTTALPPAIAEATRASLQIVRSESWRRDKLRRLTERFRDGGQQIGLDLMPSISPIQPILVGDSRRANELSQALWHRGFWVSAIRPPTVPQGSARLRVTLSAAHENHHVDSLLEALAELYDHHPE